MATPEELAQVKELIAGLPPGVRAEIKRRYRIRVQGPSNTPASILGGAMMGGLPSKEFPKGRPPTQPTGEAREQFERGGVEGALAVPTVIATVPTGVGVVGGLSTAAAAGKTALAGFGKTMLKRTLAGAATGAVLGETPLPVVGGRGFKEGAKLGAMFGAGQGGMGALWKHGKNKKTIDWIVNKLVGGADESAEAMTRVGRAGAREAVEASAQAVRSGRVATTGARAVPRAVIPSTRTMSAPAPAKAAAKTASAGTVRAAQHKQIVAFAKQEAKDAKFGEKIWMELDGAGDPIRILTPGQASAVSESSKTWIKRLWK